MRDTGQIQYHVFLSHNSAQKEWTRRLAGFLREQGLRVFFDEDSIQLGENIVVAIENGLRSSRHVLLVLSPEALASQWVALELTTSLYRDPNAASRFIIPILRRECEMPLILAPLKYLDATSEDFERQAIQLLSAVDKEAVPILASEHPERALPQTKPRVHHRELPGGGLRHDANIYVERQSDYAVRDALENGQRLITVWGARQTGKTSLGMRVLVHATRLGWKTAWVDFQTIPGGSLPQIFYHVATVISEETETDAPSAESFLTSQLGPLSAFERHLSKITVPTLIAFDEIDYLKHIGEMDTFFRFVRAFYHKQVARKPKPVSLFVSSFLSPMEFITDSFSSPFNSIGLQIRLENFDRDEASRLFELSGLELPRNSVDLLIDFTGGQPYLTHLIAYLLQDGVPVDAILHNSDLAERYFGMHLQMVLSYIEHSPTAKQTLARVVKNRRVNERDLVELIDRGILRLDNGRPVFTSALYKKYFTNG